MSFPAWLRLRSVPAGRFSIVAGALAAYLIATVGVPLPSFQAKDRSQPFPCMDRPCGCKSAAACWTSCCCTTPEERLHWAHEHGVEPPSELLAAVSSKAAEPAPALRACCARRSSTDQDRAAAAAPFRQSGGCAHDHCTSAFSAADRDQPMATAEPLRDADAVDFVVISAMRECQGFSPLWSALSAATPPPAPVNYDFEWRLAGWIAVCSDSASSLSSSPAVPPPRA
jgi:hypothetical protein